MSDGNSCDRGSGSCCCASGKWIWIGLILAIVGVLIAQKFGQKPAPAIIPVPTMNRSQAGVSNAVEAESAPAGQILPRLVDLGAGKCIPCKMMAPILEDLKRTYVGKLDVVFIDVWENPDAGKKYGINLIPTQIFYDAAGKELYRHEGFFGQDDILAKWKELGVELVK